MTSQSLRQSIFCDSPTSLGGRARVRRWEIFRRHFPEIEKMRVLDLGGTFEFWQAAPAKPRSATLINLGVTPSVRGDVMAIRGDACHSAQVLQENGIEPDFDLVFSNSLIEHVGGYARRTSLAGQIRSLAPRHWIQTPYRYFPIEPHWVFPGMQFMPVVVRSRIARQWPLGGRTEDYEASVKQVLCTELLSVTEMRSLLPDSLILHERFMGLTKSLIAVK